MTTSRRLPIATAPRRNSRHWENGTTTWAEILGWATGEIGKRKESGNYLLGRLRETNAIHKTSKDDPGTPCHGMHRKKTAVVKRSALTLDADHPEPGFVEAVGELGYETLVHTTFNSTPDEPRYRVIVPTDRDLLPDEYIAAARSLMNALGVDQFDPGSSEAERYMFRPAAKNPDYYQSWHLEGSVACVDDLLDDFTEDLSETPMPSGRKDKRDPFEIDGVIGAFNRAYSDLDLLIEEFDLPYQPSGMDRWQLVGARSQAGMGPIEGTEGLFYSHHANDPAFGKACHAFDLVRLHRYADLDENAKPSTPVNRLPSQMAMLDAATVDKRVTAEIVGVDFTDDWPADADPDSDDAPADAWRLGLALRPRTGEIADKIDNWDLIAKNWGPFRSLYYDEMRMAVITDADLPWRTLEQGGPEFSTVDRATLCLEIEREFGVRPPVTVINSLVDDVAARRFTNPVRDYLDALEWDGTPRLETCLPGVRPDHYTRMVARKSLVAAVARMMTPGVKWDHALVLYGAQGLGKSYWVDRMARGWSAPLGPIGDKDTLLVMQRSWIVTSDEGHSLRKSDADATKEFLTRREDVFRAPYDREARAHPRHNVIWSTTNDETFLRRQEGNRRYLIVRCESKVDFEALTDDYIDQVWAEAVEYWRAGELLHLSDAENELAAERREPFVEEDALAGLVETYLDTLVPADWPQMTVEARQQWLSSRAEGFVAEGTERLDEVCTAQVWSEALGRRPGDYRRVDLLDIARALRALGWTSSKKPRRLWPYGPQTVFTRPDDFTDELKDLL